MSLDIKNRWRAIDSIADLPGHMGVFELADAQDKVLYVGFAGGASRFGLRSAISEALDSGAELRSCAVKFRYEVNTAYLTRYQELVMVHRAQGRDPLLPQVQVSFGNLNPR